MSVSETFEPQQSTDLSAGLPADAPALPQNGVVEAAASSSDHATQPLPEWKVSGIFSSHMVLQHSRPITVHGWCSHIGAPVTACWAGQTVTGTVQADGSFAVTFSPRPASFEPSEMTVSSPWGSSVFTDILVGDVWVIGGQSNGDLPLAPCLCKTPEIEATLSGEHPFRLFRQTQADAMAHTEHHAAPSADIIEPTWCWKRPDAAAAKEFSALGYYVARLLSEKVKVPLGMVMMCAGGACLRELMPAELAAELGYTTGANVPVAGYYNTLIAPLLGLQFRGQIFFQGESEGIWKEMALSYDTDLKCFVEDERRRFGFDFNFYNIQLCTYRGEGAEYFPHLHWVRSRQYRAKDIIPGYYLTVSRDLGSHPEDPDFAHSPYKYALAKRVAGQILAVEYGLGSLAQSTSPWPQAVERRNNTLLVRFDCIGGGLKTSDGTAPTGFALEMENGETVEAAATILSKDTVEVTIPESVQPAALHFAMLPLAGLEQANLTGGTGLPVPAFVWPLG